TSFIHLYLFCLFIFFFFFSSRRRHTRFSRDWSSDVCSSDLIMPGSLVEWQGRTYKVIDIHSIRIFGRTNHVEVVLQSTDEGVERSEERRVGKECRSRWSPDH